MIRIVDFDLRLQNPGTGAILHPPVQTFSAVDSLPFESAPSASIQVLSSSTLSDLQAVSLVEYNDIVRLQACIKYHPDDYPAYTDIFEGKVQNMSKETGSGNTVSLECVGHIAETFKNLQKYTMTWTSTNIQTILSYINTQGNKFGRLEYDVANIESTTIPEYEIKAYQLNLSDVLKGLEELVSQKKFFGTRQVYDKWGTLQHSYLTWQSIPVVPTQIYKVEEGSNRLISASVDVIGEDVATYIYIRGDTNDDTKVQYAGSASDPVAVAKYGIRDDVDTYTWIESNSLCDEVAKAKVATTKEPVVSIQAVLEGTLDAHKGDLVSVKFSSLDIKGVKIDGNYPVMKVQQSLNEQGEFTTTLDLNRIKPDENYYRYSVTKQVQTCTVNQRCT